MEPLLDMPGSPFGVAWFFLYGYLGVPAANFMPELRRLGADFTKVYLFWNQIEPEKGRYEWSAVDAFVEQLKSPEEGLIALFSSSQWAVKRPSAMLPPSPAKEPADYYRLVYDLVRRCQGRVRYWQNDSEPNNPVFWAGTKEEFVAQLRVFHRAVKDADPSAVVLAGGYDGMFRAPDQPPFPTQQASLEFFDYVLREGADAFDLFDLRLYGDPYSIVWRVNYMRRKMNEYGHDKPFFCTEYGGPNFFEFDENRQYLPLVNSWSQAVGQTTADSGTNRIAELYRSMDALAPQTQMFMQGCSPAMEAKYHRIQCRGLVMRNLFALSAGVRRTLYWDLLAGSGARDDLMTLMYGKIGMLASEGEGLRRFPVADAFERMAAAFAGVRVVKQIDVPGKPALFVFEVDRGERGLLRVVWERRDQFRGEDLPTLSFEWPWEAADASAVDALGEHVPVQVARGQLSLLVSLTPIYIEERSHENA